jgi:glycosyltransferase involved in cell wall biosynthesis
MPAKPESLHSSAFTLSIIVTALNEAESLERAVLLIKDALQTCPRVSVFEIVLVNDGSTDATGEIAKGLSDRYPQHIVYLESKANQGIGCSFKKGAALVRYDYVGWLAADDSYLKEELVNFLNGADLFGTTVPIAYPYGECARKERSIFRRVLSRTYRFLVWAVFGLKGVRYTNGFALYRRAFLQSLCIISRRFTISTELVLRAWHAGYGFQNVKLNSVERKKGKSKIFNLTNIVDMIGTFSALFFEFNFKGAIR